MIKKISALAAGATLVAMATIMPVLAQDLEPVTTDVEVSEYTVFSISNAGDCGTAARGDCPFGQNGAGAGNGEVIIDANDGHEAQFGVVTDLAVETNSPDGWRIMVSESTNDSRSHTLRVGATTTYIPDVNADDSGDGEIELLQAANHQIDADADTGLFIHLDKDSTVYDAADEQVAFGTTDDVDTATGLWGSVPAGTANEVEIVDSDSPSPTVSTETIMYWLGVSDDEAPGDYTATIRYALFPAED